MIKSLKKKQGGFTLIELMVVIVIIGTLVAIALPNFIGAQDRAKVSSVKANMHTVQTVIETYAVDWGGVYAENFANLRTEATQTGREYWKEFTNPFTGKSGSGAIGAQGSYLSIVSPAVSTAAATLGSVAGTSSTDAGKVLYDPVVSGTAPIIRYFVYGTGKDGKAIVDKGVLLTLSNS